jgi:hypothetical protein
VWTGLALIISFKKFTKQKYQELKMLNKNKRLKPIYLLLTMAALAVLLAVPVKADSYWKVVSWQTGVGSFPDSDYAVLIPQDCKITPVNFVWVHPDRVVDSPEPVHLLIRATDPHINYHSDGEMLVYDGADSNNKPRICYSFGTAIGGGFITHTPTPPCLQSTPSNWTLNGSAYDMIALANPNSPLIMDARHAATDNGKYFLSVQLSDQSWNTYGTEIKKWLEPSQCPYCFNKTSYNIRIFCAVKNFPLQPGKFYRVKLAVSPWHSTTKLVYLCGGGGSDDPTPNPPPNRLDPLKKNEIKNY